MPRRLRWQAWLRACGAGSSNMGSVTGLPSPPALPPDWDRGAGLPFTGPGDAKQKGQMALGGSAGMPVLP